MYSGRLSVDPPQMKSILETATKLKFLPFMQPQVEAFFQNNPNIMEKNDKKTSIATIEGAEDNSPPKLPKRKRIIPLSSDSSEVDADDNNSSENKSAKTERNDNFYVVFYYLFGIYLIFFYSHSSSKTSEYNNEITSSFEIHHYFTCFFVKKKQKFEII